MPHEVAPWFRVFNFGVDRLRVGSTDFRALGGVPREQKMLKGHLHGVIYHQVY